MMRGQFGLVLQNLTYGWPMSVDSRLEPENPVGDVVHDRDPAVPRNREDAVPQVPDEVPVEAVWRHPSSRWRHEGQRSYGCG